jgi:hypothetical protein
MELRKFIVDTVRVCLNEKSDINNKNQYYLIFSNQSKDKSTIYDVIKETEKYLFLTKNGHDFRVNKKTLSVKGIKKGKDGYTWDLPKPIKLEKVQTNNETKSILQRNLDLINSKECIEERNSFPKYLLDEIGIDKILNYLIIEDGRTISRDNYIKFREGLPQGENEDIMDYIKRKSAGEFTWGQVKNKLIHNYSLWMIKEIPKDKEFNDINEALKFTKIFTMKFTYGYIIPLIESYGEK